MIRLVTTYFSLGSITERRCRFNCVFEIAYRARYVLVTHIFRRSLTFPLCSKMEQFTRDCLEVDKDAGDDKPQSQSPGISTSMEQIYERAARLVKRTLDVEGAIVMDVSHVDVVENISAECTTSITTHSDDPQVGTVTRALNTDEFAKLQDFFNKSPDGKTCEGVLPAGLRPFLPMQIQYALGGSVRS